MAGGGFSAPQGLQFHLRPTPPLQPVPTPLPLAPTSPLPSTPSLPPQAPPLHRLGVPLRFLRTPSRPHLSPTRLCLKFWRDLSINGEVPPLGHRSALIRFGKASSLPPRPDPSGANPSRAGQKVLTPFPPFPLSARVGGRGKLGEAEPKARQQNLRGASQSSKQLSPPSSTPLPNYPISLQWEGKKSYFSGIPGMCSPLVMAFKALELLEDLPFGVSLPCRTPSFPSLALSLLGYELCLP